MANSFQQPIATEPGGATWHKITNPGTGYFAEDNSPDADSFSGGLRVDFSTLVPVGTKAVRVTVRLRDTGSAPALYYRKDGDANISNTPHASQEYSHAIIEMTAETTMKSQVVLWLSSAYKVQFASRYNTGDIHIAYPIEYLL